MPWSVKRSDSCPDSHPFAVVKDADGSVEGCHANQRMAEEHMRALYANEPGNRSWFRIENRSADVASVYLYDEIGGWGVSAADFVNDLRGIETDTIDLHINSPGGAVFDGMAIFNAIRNHPARVKVVIDGVAASAASFIAMAGDEVVAERNATMMIHDGIGVAVGNAKDLRELSTLLDKFSDNIAAIYAERAGGTTQAWRERMRAETWYSAQEAKDAGLVDEVIGGRSKRAPVNKWDLSLFQYASRPETPEVSVHADNSGLDRAKAALAPPEPPPAQTADPPDEAGFLMPATGHPTVDLMGVFDRQLFTEAIQAAATNAPAPPPVRPPVTELPPLPQPAPPEPEPPDNPWDVIRVAMAMAANDAPVPPQPQTPDKPAPEPAFSFDAQAFRTALKEGIR
jgi:ATP-dependent Clp endopeptidase proteolytic subunit ClpP